MCYNKTKTQNIIIVQIFRIFLNVIYNTHIYGIMMIIYNYVINNHIEHKLLYNRHIDNSITSDNRLCKYVVTLYDRSNLTWIG